MPGQRISFYHDSKRHQQIFENNFLMLSNSQTENFLNHVFFKGMYLTQEPNKVHKLILLGKFYDSLNFLLFFLAIYWQHSGFAGFKQWCPLTYSFVPCISWKP
jgi:hypothetical protein